MPKSRVAVAAKAERDSPIIYLVFAEQTRRAFAKNGLPVRLFDHAWEDKDSKTFAGKDLVLVPDIADHEKGFPLLNAAARKLYGHGVSLGIKLLPGDFLVESDAEPESLKFRGAANAKDFFAKADVIPIDESNFECFDEALDQVLDYVRLSDVTAKPINWLWENRIARGKINIFAGDPDATKSLLTHWISARCSRGDLWLPQGSKASEGSAPMGTTIILSCEDGVADTILPRVAASGGDCNKIIALRGTKARDKRGNIVEGMFNLLDDLPKLERLLKKEGDVVLIVIDPLNAFFGSSKKVDAWRDQDVRAVLTPLAKLAEKYNVAVLIVAHNVKGSHQTALARISGTGGIGAISRLAAAIVKARDEDNEEMENRRWMLPMKKNIAVAKGVVYDVIEQPTGLPEVPKSITISLRGYINKSADEAMHEAVRGIKKDDRLDLAVEIITKHLRAADGANGRAWAKAIEEELRANTLKGSVVDRAKKRLGIRALKDETPNGGWYWTVDVTQGMPTPDAEREHEGGEEPSFDQEPSTEDLAEMERMAAEAAKWNDEKSL